MEYNDFKTHYDDEQLIKMFMEYRENNVKASTKEYINFIFNNKQSLVERIIKLCKNDFILLTNDLFIYLVEKYFNSVKAEKYLMDFINLFCDRLQKLDKEQVVRMFSISDSNIQIYYVDIFKNNIKEILDDKVLLKSLLNYSCDNTKDKIFETFKEEFKNFSAKDWYSISSEMNKRYLANNEELLLNCDIDDFSFVDKDLLMQNENLSILFQYFERNVQAKVETNSRYYNYLSVNYDYQELRKVYTNLIKKIEANNEVNVLDSIDCLCLIALFKNLLENNIITDGSSEYKRFKDAYISNILIGLESENPDNINIIKDSLFYRMIKGSINPMMLVHIKTLKGLIFFCKNQISSDYNENINIYTPAEIEKLVDNLTEEQVINMNLKSFKKVCTNIYNLYKDINPEKETIRTLAIKMYFSLGLTNTEHVLKFDKGFTRYVYLFGRTNVKNVKLNQNGEPIIDKKYSEFIIGGNIRHENSNMNKILNDKLPNMEKMFSDIFNNWDSIYSYLNGNITVARVLQLYDNNKPELNPDEYKLAKVIGEIGNNSKNIELARQLYKDMKSRSYSIIPTVKGSYNENYTYEMLDLDDPLGIVVGYITRCCFLLDGGSRTSLFHSLQSHNGRTFIVRLNGELIAQSWIWRMGNLVCFDNVETRGRYDENLLLEVYKEAANKILNISANTESNKEQVKLVTFGGAYSKISKPTEKVETNNIKSIQLENYVYSDANNDQYILACSDTNNLYYGDVNVKYHDDKKIVRRYTDISSLSDVEIADIINIINSIDYSANNSTREIKIENYSRIVITEDWYLLVTKRGSYEYQYAINNEIAKNDLYEEIKDWKSNDVASSDAPSKRLSK